MNHLPNYVRDDSDLSKNAKRILLNARIISYRQLAQMTAGRLLVRVPDMSVRIFAKLCENMKKRGLDFRKDETIRVGGPNINQKTLYLLWKANIKRYRGARTGLDHCTEHKLSLVLGPSSSRIKRVLSEMHSQKIETGDTKLFEHLGFSSWSQAFIRTRGIQDLDTLAVILARANLPKGVRVNRLLFNEMRYLLWKNRRKMKSPIEARLLPVGK